MTAFASTLLRGPFYEVDQQISTRPDVVECHPDVYAVAVKLLNAARYRLEFDCTTRADDDLEAGVLEHLENGDPL